MIVTQGGNSRRYIEKFDQFLRVTLNLLCIANTDGYFQRLNASWKRVLDYTTVELLSKRFLDFVHPDDREKTRQAISTLASQEKVTSFENRYRCKDGAYRWFEWSANTDGNLIYAAARDVTEQKITDKMLQESAFGSKA